jgi:Caspase domain
MAEKRHAVLIASSKYYDNSGLQNLRCPDNDVKEYGAFDETTVAINDEHYKILLQLGDIFDRAGKDDLILVYFSGHGKQDLLGNLYLTTTNTLVKSLNVTSIPVEQLRQLISSSRAKKIVLILDCCYSGAAGGAFLKGDVGSEFSRVAQTKGKGTYILTASTQIQAAIEKEDDEYGLLTKHIIEGIRYGGAARDDGLVSMDSLYAYVFDQVSEESPQQPMRWTLGAVGDELVIATGGRPTGEARRIRIKRLLPDLEHTIPHDIFVKAEELINASLDSLTLQQHEFDDLFDLLLEKPSKINTFVTKWRLEERVAVEGERQRKIAELYSAAEEAFRTEDLPNAISCLEKALDIDSDNAKALWLLYQARERKSLIALYDRGKAAYNLRHWAEAVEAFDQVTALNQSFRDAVQLRERAAAAAVEEKITHSLADAQEALHHEDLHSAKAKLVELLATAPNNLTTQELLAKVERKQELSTLYMEGRKFVEEQQWADALKQFNRINALDQDYKDVNHYVGLVTNELEKRAAEDLLADARRNIDREEWAEAKIKLLRSLASYPRFDSAKYELELVMSQLEITSLYKEGVELSKAQRFAKARQTLLMLESKHPDYKDVREMLSAADEELGKQDQITTLSDEAECASHEGNLQKAVALWQAAFNLDNSREDIANKITYSHKRLKRRNIATSWRRKITNRVVVLVSSFLLLVTVAVGVLRQRFVPVAVPVIPMPTPVVTNDKPSTVPLESGLPNPYRDTVNALAVITAQDPAGNQTKGMGFFVKEDEIVTALSIIDRAVKCRLNVLGQSREYDVVNVPAIDPRRRLVLLKIGEKVEGMKAARLSLDDTQLKKGDRIDFIGASEGNQQLSVKNTTVSLAGRNFSTLSESTPADRGAPILDKQGYVAGIIIDNNSENNNAVVALDSQLKNLWEKRRKPLTLALARARILVFDLTNDVEVQKKGVDGKAKRKEVSIPSGLRKDIITIAGFTAESGVKIESSATGHFTRPRANETAYLVDANEGPRKKIVIVANRTPIKAISTDAHTILNVLDLNNDNLDELLLADGYNKDAKEVATTVSLLDISAKSENGEVRAIFPGFSDCDSDGNNTASAIYSSLTFRDGWPIFRVDTYKGNCQRRRYYYDSSASVP